jgi:hypothetical protein
MQITFEMLCPKSYPKPTFGAGDSLAKVFHRLGNGEVFQTLEELLSLKYSGLLPYADPEYYSLKMSKDFSTTTMEEPSEQSCPRWQDWGIMSNGNVLTARLMYPKTGSGYLLSDIMERTPDERYFLSKQSAERLLNRLSEGRKAHESTTPPEQARP